MGRCSTKVVAIKDIKKIKQAKIIIPIKRETICWFFQSISYNNEFIALEYKKGSNLATTIYLLFIIRSNLK